ncbi:hypothetical protein [Hymenobacter algoricola]|uniref:Uncharacterized protein n=1 Tax=Hymenobacter algoricola TaxID=486267 RepID=A0ABP7NMQ8_9BACT
MEKVQTLLIILFAVGALVWRMVQKARETAAREIRERPTSQGPPLPATSFQELLRQMQAQNEAGRQIEPPAAETRPVFQEPAPARETSQQRTRRQEEQPRPIVRPAVPRPEVAPPTAPLQVQQATRPNATTRQVTDMLRNPADVRAAFVLSEILKPKF